MEHTVIYRWVSFVDYTSSVRRVTHHKYKWTAMLCVLVNNLMPMGSVGTGALIAEYVDD